MPANVENVRCACETLVTTGTAVVALLFSLDRSGAARSALVVAATMATIGALVSLSRLRKA